MKLLYCWRCRMAIPMLDDDEFSIVWQLYRDAFMTAEQFTEKYGTVREPLTIKERFQPVCDAYEQMTGFHETNAVAILHHRISMYGLPCGGCGKPLRTPRARFCASCGWKPDEVPANSK